MRNISKTRSIILQFSYKTEPGQLFLLQSLSSHANQNITYHCKNSVAYYDSRKNNYQKAVKLMGFNDVQLVAAGYPKFTYQVSQDGCKVCSCSNLQSDLDFNILNDVR